MSGLRFSKKCQISKKETGTSGKNPPETRCIFCLYSRAFSCACVRAHAPFLSLHPPLSLTPPLPLRSAAGVKKWLGQKPTVCCVPLMCFSDSYLNASVVSVGGALSSYLGGYAADRWGSKKKVPLVSFVSVIRVDTQAVGAVLFSLFRHASGLAPPPSRQS